jgi:hypothetical protein
MEHGEFYIGLEFWCGDVQWRCTDVGSRTVIAIRIDSLEMTSMNLESNVQTKFLLPRDRAEAEGRFNGPPYAVAEIGFDENDFEVCTLSAEIHL